MRLPLAAAVLLVGARAAAGSTCPVPGPEDLTPRPRLGVALGGGSARGLAHIGVLQVFEENRIPVDLVAGTSMGSIIGALYATGLTPTELTEVARSIDWANVFSGRGDRRLEAVAWRVDDVPAVLSIGVRRGRLLAPAAAFSDYRVGRVLTSHLAGAGLRAGGDFDRLPIPYRAVATDLRTGERVVLSRGDLPRSVRASMSLPVFFPPVEIDGRVLVDGGLVDNVPAGVARDMGADVVVAVDVGIPPRELAEDADILAVVGRMTDFMMTSGNRSFAEPPDLTIHPVLVGFESSDYDRFEELIAAGREAALAALPELQPLLCGRQAVRQAAASGGGSGPEGRVARVTVKGLKRVDERLVLRRLRVREGSAFDLEAAQKGMDAVWASNLFSSAWLQVAPAEGGDLEVSVGVRERPVMRAGLGLSYNETDNARGFLRLRNGNLLGLGERLDLRFRVDSGLAEFDGVMGNASLAGSPLGYRLGLRIAEEKPKVYDAVGEELGRARFRQFRGLASVQHAIGGDGLLEVSLVAGRAEVDERSGIPFAPQEDTVVKAGSRLVFDSVDNRFFPSRGMRVDVRGEKSLDGLGASLDYWRTSLSVAAYASVGRRGLIEGHVFGGAARSATTPVYDLFRVGGPILVPGRSRDEMWGAWAGAVSLGLGARLSSQWRIILRAGAGNAWADSSEIQFSDLRAGGTIGLARNTPVGPIAVDLGLGGGGLKVYVSLGFQ
jgi:NTE family protein